MRSEYRVSPKLYKAIMWQDYDYWTTGDVGRLRQRNLILYTQYNEKWTQELNLTRYLKQDGRDMSS